MRNGRLLIMSLIAAAMVSPVFAQSHKFDYHPAYGPAPLGGNPQSMARQLSHDNFISIRWLNAAIMNYGGGEAEIDTLIDVYSDASALYFQNKMMESAKKFIENQTAIMQSAKQLAGKYSTETAAILKECMELSLRSRLKMGIRGDQGMDSVDKYLGQAKAGVFKANDYHERFKDAKAASARELITAIYLYRGAKANMFEMLTLLADVQSRFLAEQEVKAMLAKKEISPGNKERVRREKEDQKRKELLSRYLDKYVKDMADNKNVVYQAREKEK
ncbi:MAG: hypothetical protein JW838_00940 [Spirochaetes bacterium]|nr:hypothetical protein [Spirochaetota bacterium]